MRGKGQGLAARGEKIFPECDAFVAKGI
jgi:hypothetical protein